MPDLPAGTVTFLFTDIEGSTAIWERDRHAMATTVERHLALLRAAIESHDGVLFKVVGDAVQAAFPNAPDAVAAAVEAQRAILVEDWRPHDPLRVRMALHAGEATPDPRGDYLSASLNRLARLLDAGHGGQILLSQTVQQLIRGGLPPGVALRDLDEHHLRDLLDSEHIYQLLHPDLPSEFPPLTTLLRRSHNFPSQSTPFIGREEDVSRVVALLRHADTRLLTLTGPGGVGKSRLALAAAERMLVDFPDGAVFVDLAPLTDPALVPGTVAAALGVREQPTTPVLAAIGEAMRDRHCLLVVDNFEHVLGAATVVSQLLAAAPRVKVLVTSRARLQLSAEQELPVSPMAVPDPAQLPGLEQLEAVDAIRLFITRARSVKPDLILTETNAPVIAAICRRLDGLPLALELAAARIKLLPPQALLNRLEQRLPLLTGGARDLPARQRTLRDAIAWSYDLLSEDDCVLFRRLGIFVNGWSLDAADAVVNPDGALDVLTGMASLVDKSLVREVDQPDGEPRFSMLETVREFALEQLGQRVDEANGLRQAHAAWCVGLVGVGNWALEVSEPSRLDRLATEYDNVRAALAWFWERDDAEALATLTATLSQLWQVTGQGHEGLEWVARALSIRARSSPETRMRLLAGAGLLVVQTGDHERATTLGQELLALARERSDREAEVTAWLLLSRAANQGAANIAAMTYAETGLALARELGDIPMLPWMLQRLGIEAQITGDHARAAELIEEALGLFRTAHDVRGTAYALTNLGWTRHRLGEVSRAAALYQENLILHQGLRDVWETAGVLEHTAFLIAEAGSAYPAARLLGAVARLYQRTGTTRQPYFREFHDPAESLARAALSSEAYAAAWEAGRQLSLDQAIEEGLAALRAFE